MILRIPLGNGDLAVALFLAGLGAAWAYLSWQLGLGSTSEPGAGFFPFGVSLLLIAGAIGCAVRAIIHRSRAREAEKDVVVDTESIRAALLIAALCLLFANAGFLPVGFVFMWLMLAWVGRVSAARATIASAIVVAVFWLFFERLLGIELPGGFVGEFLGPRLAGWRDLI